MVTNLLFGDDYFDFERRHFVLATMAIAFFRRSLVRFPLVSEQRCEIDNKVAVYYYRGNGYHMHPRTWHYIHSPWVYRM